MSWPHPPVLHGSRRHDRRALDGLTGRPQTDTMKRMEADALRDLCLTFRGSEETFPFGFETSVFKVAGKMFALSRLQSEPLSVSLKCEPQLAEQLRAAHPCITAGYHLNKRHWNTVVIDGSLSDQTIADMVEDSYDLIVSKLSRARQRALLWRGAR
jgi:predicted DNA-binding protein (MmcQ/YjbR family)